MQLSIVRIKQGQHLPSELSRLSLELERQHSKWAILRRHGSPECRLRVLVAVVFFTSGGIPMSGDEKPALLNFVRSGGGFTGVHYFYAWASVLYGAGARGLSLAGYPLPASSHERYPLVCAKITLGANKGDVALIYWKVAGYGGAKRTTALFLAQEEILNSFSR
jgi:hypothetical protein